MEWIKVSDKEPEFEIPVLVYCPIYGRFIATHVFIGELEGKKYGNWQYGLALGILPPTHWMPLPEPPQN